MTPPKVCAFCPETANSGEHIFADWIGRLLTKRITHYVFRDTSPVDRTERKWVGRKLDRKFKKSVCKQCNSTWMSDIDNAARHTLGDIIRYRAPVSFLTSGIESIAAFTLKNAFVADYTHIKPFFGSYFRSQFKECRHFPLGTYMWLGGVKSKGNVRYGVIRTMYGKPDVDAPNGVEMYVFTWAAEGLLLQLVAGRYVNVLYKARGWPELSQDPRFGDMFIPFWPPPRTPVTWPPQELVSHRHLDTIAERFKGIRYW